MRGVFIDVTGYRAGSLVLFQHVGGPFWRAWCDCGKAATVRSSDVRAGRTSSCGCKTYEAEAPRDRFWRMVDKSGGPDACWPWQGARLKAGYGVFGAGTSRTDKRNKLAHVFAYENSKSVRVPKGKVVRHWKCDNPPCCNPGHLRRGTQRRNILDSIERGRWNSAKRGVRGERHPSAKLKARQVRSIRRAFDRNVDPHRIGQRFGIPAYHVRLIGRRKIWRSLP